MWTMEEQAVFRRLKNPESIQRYLDEEIEYNSQTTCYSPRLVMRHRAAHCMEGALFAVAALAELGHPPLLMDLEAVRDDDHVLALFREHGRWGAIAKSNYAGLRYRTPIYHSLQELAISYFEHYFNPRGEKTLRAWAGPVKMGRFRHSGWQTAEDDPWYIPEYLVTLEHRPLLPPQARGRRFHMDDRLLAAGRVGSAH